MRFREKVKAWHGEALLSVLWVVKSLCKPLGITVFYRSLIIRLIKRRGLFDRSYYLEVNNDVAQAGMLPLRHYVSYGDKEGRPPMALFDPAYYRSHTQGRTKHVNTLLHYSYVGRYRRISPSPWFDVDYYLSNNKDIARSHIDPLLHYLKWGGIEGRSPCSQFDSAYYLRTYPDVAESGMNPLIHYLFIGRPEARSTQPEHNNGHIVSDDSFALPLPSEAEWCALNRRGAIKHAEVDVIVPVYKARIETLRCIHSVLKADCRTPFELIVINDASPDLELVGNLQRLANLGFFTLLSNPKNCGFIHTVNRGMQLHDHRNVVLLNSDTEVYNGWLDRLNNAAHRNLKTGTVTPLSNNATICSYPNFLHDNPYPLEFSYAELDELTARVNSCIEVEAPTGVGFCMFIKRACLQAVGLFDEKAFGKGYGEENDFCQKAIQKGWRNVITADAFVRHLGAASFQGEKAKLLQAALKTIDKRYPRYRKDVNHFIDLDPLKDARCNLDLARMQRLSREKNVLIVCHNRGGGTERHIQEDILTLTGQGYGVFLLRPMSKKQTHAILSHPSAKSFPNINPFALAETSTLVEALKILRITEVHTHSLVDFIPEAIEYLSNTVKSLEAYWEANLHDYKIICPRVNLVDENGLYCGEPVEAECNRCLTERGSDFGVTNIHAWREMHSRALLAADHVFVPDPDVADRLSGYFSEINFEVSPHEPIDLDAIQIVTPRIQPEERMRVVIIGAIGKLKGFHVIISCAKHARQHNLPIEFIVLGYSMNDKLLEEAGVFVTGKYHDHEALDKLNSLNPHVVWLPSLWPETYSYTLSLALMARLPVFAFNLGAIARRLKASGMDDMLMPLSWADTPAKIIHQFETFRKACLHFH